MNPEPAEFTNAISAPGPSAMDSIGHALLRTVSTKGSPGSEKNTSRPPAKAICAPYPETVTRVIGSGRGRRVSEIAAASQDGVKGGGE